MLRARELAARWAPGSHPVLIVGESGVGHELMGRTLHELSGRPALHLGHAGVLPVVFEQTLEQTPKDGTLYLAYADPDELPVRAGKARHNRIGPAFFLPIGAVPDIRCGRFGRCPAPAFGPPQ